VFTKQKNLFGTPYAPGVDRPYAIKGTYGLAVIRCWYVAMTEVTLVSLFVAVLKYLLQTQHSTRTTQHTNPLTT